MSSVNAPVGRVPSRGMSASPGVSDPMPSRGDYLPRRLRRLPRVSPDRHGTISFLLTICVDGRDLVLDNETTFGRLTAFLLDSPKRYHWLAGARMTSGIALCNFCWPLGLILISKTRQAVRLR